MEGDLENSPNEDLLNQWDTTIDFEERDRLIEILQRRKLFPQKSMTEWEAETGSYPLYDDPEFLQKLLAKREFAETFQESWKPSEDPCGDVTKFEVTPVQRFVANLMSPKSPYMSALLYHGVGVGKTCAAVQITEAWLEAFPRDKIFLVTPPTIQQGFYKTMFDAGRLTIAEEDGVPNQAIGCTGDRYMKLTGTLLERDRAKIQRKVNTAIRSRYSMFGYISFANHIRDLLKGIPTDLSDDRKEELTNTILRREFSGKLLVVDEAHNLRDVPGEVADEDGPGGDVEKSDAVAGKQLTPYLLKVLRAAEGMKLVLLTATPMYNSYREIIYILNLLLMNDKMATLSEGDIFKENGSFKTGAEEKLGAVAMHYVSFMRGENPLSFPIRLKPNGVDIFSRDQYPGLNPRSAPVVAAEKIYVDNLPIVPVLLEGDVLKASIAFMNDLPAVTATGTGGLSSIVLEKLVHAGNFIVPPTDETAGDTLDAYKARTDINSIETIFTRTVAGEVRYKAKIPGNARWLGADQIAPYSSKFVILLDRLRKSEGVDFVYTRFVGAGALPLALALEANGYTPVGRSTGLLVDGIQTPGGRQCAYCANREEGHTGSHPFSPAYYGLLTGNIQLSPHNDRVISLERDLANVNGGKLKVIIGSQIAAEGVDLRFVREIHVLDSWFHLNKTEQILGRGIRFCSHSALPSEKRNVTVYLYAAIMPRELNRESADLYSYRVAFRKAVQMGRVSRVLKESAIDCNLNRNAIIIAGQAPVRQIDSQRMVRDAVSINDMPFTSMCDWTECAYDCKPTIAIKPTGSDDSTYSEFAARWRENSLKERLRKLFELQPSYSNENLFEMLDIPEPNIIDLLTSVVDNRLFQISHKGVDGYIRYCNRYFIFQPNIYGDLSIPMALRVAKIPVRRDEYSPAIHAYVEEVVEDIEEGNNNVNDERSSAQDVWAAIVEWCTTLAGSPADIEVPGIIHQRIRTMSRGDVGIETKFNQVLEMVTWFQRAFHASTGKKVEIMRNALLEFFWDNWFSLDEQVGMVNSGTTGANTMISEFQHMIGSTQVNRFFNITTGDLHFTCKGGAVCTPAILREVERDKDDSLRKINLSAQGVGALYGFIVSKNGNVVFKTNEPLAPSKKVPGRGAECANVSNMSGHLKKLKAVGNALRIAGLSDFQLNDVVMLGTHKVVHAIRACTLLEIVLRYTDKIGVQHKRWFLRPVSAYYTKHASLFRAKSVQSAKVTV